jgi:hypothetical protein
MEAARCAALPHGHGQRGALLALLALVGLSEQRQDSGHLVHLPATVTQHTRHCPIGQFTSWQFWTEREVLAWSGRDILENRSSMRLCGPSAPAGGTPFGRGCGRKDESKERPFFYGMAYARMSLRLLRLGFFHARPRGSA